MMLKWLFMIVWLIVLNAPVLPSLADEEVDESLPRIAIVGAGISGTSAAYFLRNLFGDKTHIDVFEAVKVGGRAAVVRIDGQDFEAGASVIHQKNRYMVSFAQQFNKTANTGSDSTSYFGLWAKSGLVFQTSEWQLVSLAKLIWRYGLDLYTLREWTKNSVLSKFERIYDFQSHGMAFTTVEDMLKAMGDQILNMTRYSLQECLTSAGLSPRFIDELAMAAMRCNYGQTTQAHGFVGAVSLVGAEPGLWSVTGGNRQIAVSLLDQSKARLLEAKVTSVTLIKNLLGTNTVNYEVEYETTNSAGEKLTHSGEYDIVVIATPIFGTKDKISFVDFPNPVTPFSQDYHQTVAMFVQGRLNSTSFNSESVPPTLFTVSPDVFFNSINKQNSVDSSIEGTAASQDKNVWKTFLNKVPTQEEINFLFDNRKDLRLIDWLAYPEYKPGMDLPPFMLYDKLYYINAIESAAAAMEMNVIGSRNVALLAFNHWSGNLDKIDELNLPVESGADRSEL